MPFSALSSRIASAVNSGREQVRVYRALNMSDAVDDRAEPLVLLPQIGKLRFSVCKIHFRSLR